MGKLLQGINGPVSGKVGNVVGYLLHDIPVVRGLRKRKRKKFSEKELNQQARFTIMNRFLVPEKDLLNITFAHLAFRMKGFNKAFSYNVKAAILGFCPDLSIDYSMVLMSRGDLTKAESPSVAVSGAEKLLFTWTDNTGKGKASATDKVFAAVHEPVLGWWMDKMDLATRSAGECELALKAGVFEGRSLHVYLGFVAAEGNDASDSVYLGMVNVPPK
ncbi:MAG TPA: DUF6266 family protein [Puia sp.]|jgi:hypothetical protein